MKRQRHYLCGRGRLATLLMENGCAVYKTVNPFNTDYPTAWDVPLTKKSASVIRHYFRHLGKPYPRAVSDEAFKEICGEAAVGREGEAHD